jgi:hypothetical protein
MQPDQRLTPAPREARLSMLLRAAASDIESLEGEVDDLCRRLTAAEGDSREHARQVYRRGYFAGHAAGKRGAARETSPERHARRGSLEHHRSQG